jgi:hypothetical protein
MSITSIGLYGGVARRYVVQVPIPGESAGVARTGQLGILTTRLGRMRIARTRQASLKVN